MKERQQNAQSQPANPQGKKPGEEQKKPGQRERNDRQAENDRKREGAADPAGPPPPLAGSKGAGPDAGWGNLPPKVRGDMQEAKRREPPAAWRKQVEDYYRKLTEPKK